MILWRKLLSLWRGCNLGLPLSMRIHYIHIDESSSKAGGTHAVNSYCLCFLLPVAPFIREMQ